MVKAGCPAYAENTLAARPVGASNTTLYSIFTNTLTTAATNEVFPVPAYPFRTNTPSSLCFKKKSDKTRHRQLLGRRKRKPQASLHHIFKMFLYHGEIYSGK